MKNLKHLIAALLFACWMRLSGAEVSPDGLNAALFNELINLKTPSASKEFGKEALILISSMLVASLTGIRKGSVIWGRNEKFNTLKNRMLCKTFTKTSVVYACLTIARFLLNLMDKNGMPAKLETLRTLIKDQKLSSQEFAKIKCEFEKIERNLNNVKKPLSARILRLVAILIGAVSLCELIIDNSENCQNNYTSLFTPLLGVSRAENVPIKYSDPITHKSIKGSYTSRATKLIPSTLAYILISLTLTEGMEYLNRRKTAGKLAEIKKIISDEKVQFSK